MKKNGLLGIHHITALASDPQHNVDFYTGFLGLRLVKKTVNFDAPDVYHFYYGDETGQPGTILTFFPFPNAARGKRGGGETTAVAFSIPPASVEFWIDRIAARGLECRGPFNRFNQQVIGFEDPDGMIVELVADPAVASLPGWKGSPVGSAHVPRLLHGATFSESDSTDTIAFLTEVLGFTAAGEEANLRRFVIGDGLSKAHIDVLQAPDGAQGRQSAGSIHHIAWRVANDEGQKEWRETLTRARAYTTPVQNRMYFRSIYFREPGGILFEIATDIPGFLIDEPVTDLGNGLQLPPWLEKERDHIEQVLIPVEQPAL